MLSLWMLVVLAAMAEFTCRSFMPETAKDCKGFLTLVHVFVVMGKGENVRNKYVSILPHFFGFFPSLLHSLLTNSVNELRVH